MRVSGIKNTSEVLKSETVETGNSVVIRYETKNATARTIRLFVWTHEVLDMDELYPREEHNNNLKFTYTFCILYSSGYRLYF